MHRQKNITILEARLRLLVLSLFLLDFSNISESFFWSFFSHSCGNIKEWRAKNSPQRSLTLPRRAFHSASSPDLSRILQLQYIRKQRKTTKAIPFVHQAAPLSFLDLEQKKTPNNSEWSFVPITFWTLTERVNWRHNSPASWCKVRHELNYIATYMSDVFDITAI